MASEPELRIGGSGEWVLYLRQSRNQHYRQSVGACPAAIPLGA